MPETIDPTHEPEPTTGDPTRFVVVMGVSGSGKTTLAVDLARAMGWEYAEGDEFHPAANVEKMSAGTPLTDEDRWPWLESIRDWMRARPARGGSAVITCSALKRAYREVLTDVPYPVHFAHVHVDRAELERRLAEREGHYMPPSLLQSQLDTLEMLGEDEPGTVIESTGGPDAALAEACEELGLEVG